MLVQLETMFGEDFLKNVVLEFTHYSFHADQVGRKNEYNNEKGKKAEMNKILKKYFKFQVRPFVSNFKHWLIVRLDFQNDLPAVFIDTYYTKSDPDQEKKFEEYMTKLWNLADGMTPYNVSDIKAVQNELAIKNQELIHLANLLNICNGK